MNFTKGKSRCSMCDAWYLPEDEEDHRHPEPQSGELRTEFMQSGMDYNQWIANTESGRNWLATDPVRHRGYRS